MPYFAYVTAVLEGGVSDRAGMKAGDMIIKIKNKTFDSHIEADQILQSNKPGETVEYIVLRENEPYSLYLTLSIFGIAFGTVVSVGVGIIFFLTGIFLGYKSPQHFPLRLISMSFLLLGFFIATALTTRDYGFDWFIASRIFLVKLSILLGVTLLIHSFQYFPKPIEAYLKKKWLNPLLYTLFFIMLVISTINIYLNFYSDQFAAEIFYFFLIGILSLGLRIYERKNIPKESKLMARPVKFSFIIALIGFFLISIFITGNLFNIGFVTLPFILVPFGYLYTIGRYDLYDLEVRIRRNIQYTFISILWNLFFISLIIVLIAALVQQNFNLPNIQISNNTIEILDKPLTPERRLIMERSFFALLTLIIVLAGSKVLFKVQRIINRYFYQSKFDYRQSLKQLSEFSQQPETGNIFENIVEKIAQLLPIKHFSVTFFNNPQSIQYSNSYNCDNKTWTELLTQLHQKIVGEFLKTPKIIRPIALGKEADDVFSSYKYFLLVPVFNSRKSLIGYLALGEKQSESAYHRDDFDFLNSATRHIAIAIENSYLYQELAKQERMRYELEVARDIQMSSLPQNIPKIRGLDISGKSIPALEVGGDYFDYLNGSPGKLTIVVGDVSGKGTSSALYMSKVQGILRSLNSFNLTPADLFVKANQILSQDLNKKYFITAVAGLFDIKQKKLVLARAGHLPLYHYYADEKIIKSHIPAGIGLGLGYTGEFQQQIEQVDVNYKKNDVFIFITDGVTEAFNSTGHEYGEEQILRVIEENHSASSKELCEALLQDVNNFSTGIEQHDDMTVVVVKVT